MPNITDLLERLAYPISRIDRGCPVCIGSFIEDANEMLGGMGIAYRYDQDENGTVVLVQPEEAGAHVPG